MFFSTLANRETYTSKENRRVAKKTRFTIPVLQRSYKLGVLEMFCAQLVIVVHVVRRVLVEYVKIGATAVIEPSLASAEYYLKINLQ
jgi:hypothetical protein